MSHETKLFEDGNFNQVSQMMGDEFKFEILLERGSSESRVAKCWSIQQYSDELEEYVLTNVYIYFWPIV